MKSRIPTEELGLWDFPLPAQCNNFLAQIKGNAGFPYIHKA